MTLPTCRHRGRIHGAKVTCRSDKADRIGGGLAWLATCEGCPVADVPNRVYEAVPDVVTASTEPPDVPIQRPTFDTSFPECKHRGAKIEDKEADLCGLKGHVFEVMACDVVESGRCVATRICWKQTEVPCSTCDKRET